MPMTSSGDGSAKGASLGRRWPDTLGLEWKKQKNMKNEKLPKKSKSLEKLKKYLGTLLWSQNEWKLTWNATRSPKGMKWECKRQLGTEEMNTIGLLKAIIAFGTHEAVETRLVLECFK